MPKSVYEKDETQAAFLTSLEDRLRAIPGVKSAALVDSLPFSNNGGMASFAIQGRPTGPNDPGPHGSIRVISPGYFETLRIPFQQGRDFTDGDRKTTEQVAIVDEVLARQYFPGTKSYWSAHRIRIQGTVVHDRGSRVSRPRELTRGRYQ